MSSALPGEPRAEARASSPETLASSQVHSCLATGGVLPRFAHGFLRLVPRPAWVAPGPVALELWLHFSPGAATVLRLTAHVVPVAVTRLSILPGAAAGPVPLLPPLTVAWHRLTPARATGLTHGHVAFAFDARLFATHSTRDVLG